MKKIIFYSIFLISCLSIFTSCSYALNEAIGATGSSNSKAALPTPTSFTIDYSSYGKPYLSWIESKRATGYEVYASTQSGNIKNATKIAETKDAYYTDSDFSESEIKFYWVRAINSKKNKYSDYTNWILIKGTSSNSDFGETPSTAGSSKLLNINPSSAYYTTRSITEGETVYWYYNLTKGIQYNVHWVDCKDGTSLTKLGNPTGDISVSCYLSNSPESYIFNSVDNGYTEEQSFIAGYTGYFMIAIQGISAGSFGLGIYEKE